MEEYYSLCCGKIHPIWYPDAHIHLWFKSSGWYYKYSSILILKGRGYFATSGKIAPCYCGTGVNIALQCQTVLTQTLEAKDRNARGQGPRTQPQVFSKKKVLSLSGDLQFISVPRIFDWGRPKPQITCYDVNKNFQKRNVLSDKDIVG